MKKTREKTFLICLFALLTFASDLFCINKGEIKKELQSTYFENLYSRTYYSLKDRIHPDGYLPESLTGAYPGMFPRTAGAFALLMMETGRYEEAESCLRFVLRAVKETGMERIPRIIGKDKDRHFIVIDDQHQIDGQAHVLLAWARLALARGENGFEDSTWEEVCAIMKRSVDRPMFQYGNLDDVTTPCLVKNTNFEHSRDARTWDTWDLLTQSFIGAALEDMIKIAERRNQNKLANDWKWKLNMLKEGIDRFLIIKREDGEQTYVEMLNETPDGTARYMGMGWVCYSPIAAGWEAAGHQIMRNTVRYMEKHYLQNSNGVTWMPTDGYENDIFSNEMIGKGIGWEIDFARTEDDFQRINEILHMIRTVNSGHAIYMEGAWLDGDGYRQNQHITRKDLEKMKNCVWKVKDAGNGEQTAWWCWAMARLRKSVGLPPEPQRENN